ncbi:class I SAM-dependent methyltransferase [Actinocorallia populi]|uniref:class I SAM-dependent methyltransferase n=1 Tax=Actinocorallia populi TaxID=2079200 RepID=UPI000D09547F|nr:class I SAM-dependent methyltransferase [Actinocorallia populi]
MTHRHPLFARFYARTSLAMERGLATHRRTLLEGLSGRVIEVGAGNGLNFAHYPAAVTGILAVEPEPHLRSLAQANAKRAAAPVEVVDGVADRLPAEDASCDAAVASLVLCSVPDQATALAEMFRVVRPGGQLRFFEHVQAASPGRRRVQKALDATVYPFFGGGCHCARDTATAIERAGFTIDRIDRLGTAQTQVPFPAAPQILGVAVRP